MSCARLPSDTDRGCAESRGLGGATLTGEGTKPSRSAQLRTGASASRRIPRHRFGAGSRLQGEVRRRVGRAA